MREFNPCGALWNSMTLLDYLRIIRPLNCIVAGVAALIGYWISALWILLDLNALLVFLAVFLVCAGGQAVNDYFDLEIDRRKKAKKALALGKANAGIVFSLALLLFAAGILVSYFLGFFAFLIAVIMSLLLFSYSAFFQKAKFFGNWIVALGTAMTLVFGASVIGNFEVVFWLFWPMLFANLSREIIKDFEDLNADKGLKNTLPMVLGVKRAKLLVGIFYIIAIVLAFWIFSFGIVQSLAYLLLLFPTTLVFLLSAKALGWNSFAKAQAFSKLGMLLALLAFFAILV
ncbi:MAG: UbiA family prenyltransferase [Candidatus Diapherotrites archaeon]|uniref:UbiA family prenyltransferase n=1 Tax=Candidatus Iainarchaeum sp. TaxID=3101447 RepID=A0A7J4KU39_9ARCH|nr:UbiA family prenyltransferase [Candidatus Diapherotrites archaeon]HIH33531.1 UbiA family prenyltransferase [Candidatus Diapherotrites archaeon]